MASLDQLCYRAGILLYATLTGACATTIHQEISALRSEPPALAVPQNEQPTAPIAVTPNVHSPTIAPATTTTTTTTTVCSLTVEAMTIPWRFVADTIHITATAPTTGWVAVGFQMEDAIVDANLVMGAVMPDQVRIEDRYVVAAGDHRPVAELGGMNALLASGGHEVDGWTTLYFQLPSEPRDPYHRRLTPGTVIYLIAAYSVDDDFAHHSRMRRHVRVTL